METKKKKFAVPHTYVILIILVLICAIMTWLIPAGAYDRVEDAVTGKMVVDPNSFHLVEDEGGLGFFDVMLEFIKGMESASSIIFFIFIIGGAFTIIQDTGAMSASIHALVRKFGKKQNFILVLFIFLFSVLGGTMGMAEELIVFIPLLITLCNELKLDRMVALAVAMIGARVGFTTGLINPFTVGVAQGMAELPLYSGLGYRLIWYGVILVFTCWYILRYAKRIKEDPTRSIMHGIEIEGEEEELEVGEAPALTGRRIAVIVLFFASLVAMVFGVFKYGWYMEEIATTFLILGIAAGIIGGMGPSVIAKSFVRGAADMTFAALVVGVAKAVLLTLQDGGIIDTVVFYASSVLSHLPKMVAAWGMYIFQLLLNFLIPSGSGQAAATMPIMATLSDTLGITRQTAVLCFHYGDGFTNLVAPTLGTLMGCIAVSKVPFEKYLKWVMPLLFVWIAVGFVSITIAVLINYGPF